MSYSIKYKIGEQKYPGSDIPKIIFNPAYLNGYDAGYENGGDAPKDSTPAFKDGWDDGCDQAAHDGATFADEDE